jgi:hypothetical protein
MVRFSQESEALTLAFSEQELKRYGRWKLTITVDEYSPSTFQMLRDLQMCANVESITYESLTSLAGDSPAKTLATPESELE